MKTPDPGTFLPAPIASRPPAEGDRQERRPAPLPSNPRPGSEPESGSPASSPSANELDCGPTGLVPGSGIRLARTLPQQTGWIPPAEPGSSSDPDRSGRGGREEGRHGDKGPTGPRTRALGPQKGRPCRLAALPPQGGGPERAPGGRGARPGSAAPRGPHLQLPGRGPAAAARPRVSGGPGRDPAHVRFRVRGAWSPRQPSRARRPALGSRAGPSEPRSWRLRARRRARKTCPAPLCRVSALFPTPEPQGASRRTPPGNPRPGDFGPERRRRRWGGRAAGPGLGTWRLGCRCPRGRWVAV